MHSLLKDLSPLNRPAVVPVNWQVERGWEVKGDLDTANWGYEHRNAAWGLTCGGGVNRVPRGKLQCPPQQELRNSPFFFLSFLYEMVRDHACITRPEHGYGYGYGYDWHHLFAKLLKLGCMPALTYHIRGVLNNMCSHKQPAEISLMLLLATL